MGRSRSLLQVKRAFRTGFWRLHGKTKIRNDGWQGTRRGACCFRLLCDSTGVGKPGVILSRRSFDTSKARLNDNAE
jgi:hypothetical protein